MGGLIFHICTRGYVAQQIVTVRSPKSCNVTPTLPSVIISTIITTHTPFCFSSPPPPGCTRRGEIQFLSAVSAPRPAETTKPKEGNNAPRKKCSRETADQPSAKTYTRRRTSCSGLRGPPLGVGGTKMPFPGYLRACRRRKLTKAKLSGRKSNAHRFSHPLQVTLAAGVPQWPSQLMQNGTRRQWRRRPLFPRSPEPLP